MARLLAQQGHVTSAREVLGAVLERSPGDEQATELAHSLRDLRDQTPRAEPAEEPLAAPVAGNPAKLAAAFARAGALPSATLVRLRALLARVQEQRHEPAR